MIDKNEVIDAVSELFLPLLIIVAAILGLSVIIKQTMLEIGFEFAMPGIGSIMIASTGVLSLFLAWKEFIYKNKVYLEYDWDFTKKDDQETAELTFTNTSDRIVRLNYLTASIATWRKYDSDKEDAIYFNNKKTFYFDDKTIEPGDSATVNVGDNLVLFDIIDLPVRNWKGEKVELENDLTVLERTLKRTDRTPEELLRSGPKLYEIYEEVQNIDHSLGTQCSISEIKQKSVEELMRIHKH